MQNNSHTLGFKCISGMLIASHTQALTPPTGRFVGHRVWNAECLVYMHITQASVFFPFDRAAIFPIATHATGIPSGTLAERASSKTCVIHTVIIDIPDAHGARGKS